MAFVFKAEKNYQTTQQQPPPSYNTTTIKKIRKNKVPFNSSIQKLKDIPSQTPGPGFYQQQQSAKQKMIIVDEQQNIKLSQGHRPSSVFLSPGRTPLPNAQTPSPCHYFQNTQSVQVVQRGKKPQIIQKLIQLNKYQSIPSIPNKDKVYGYVQVNGQLVANKKKQVQENQVKVCQDKGYQFTRSKRFQKKNSSANLTYVGPGKYQNNRVITPSYKLKQSSSFMPKRSQTPKQKPIPFRQQQSTIQQSFQYIEETTPGPGSYQSNIGLKKNYQNKHYCSFGSNVDRFIQKRATAVNKDNQVQKKQKIKRIVKQKGQKFSQVERFGKLIEQQIGPGTYNSNINNLENKVKSKYSRGKFGSTQKRFKPSKKSPIQYYDPPKTLSKAISSCFKSETTRNNLPTKTSLPPGIYQLNYYDIFKQQVKIPQDKQIKVWKPPFGVSEPRFEPQIKQEIIPQIKYAPQQKKRKVAGFSSKQFKGAIQKKAIQAIEYPDPASYDIQLPWNKRSYNILFVDIL